MSDSRVRVWFSLFVLAVFCVGLLAGVLIGRRLTFGGPDRIGGAGPGGPGPLRPGGRGSGPPPAVLLERLTRELDLDDAQREQVAVVLEESRDRVRQLQRDVRGRFDAEQRRLRDDIRALLRPDQQERFEKWSTRRPRAPAGR